MLYIGTNIRSKEALKPLSEKELYSMVVEDSLGLATILKHLRSLRAIDKGIYNQKKRDLPYFCISQFKSNERHGANFKQVEYVILDFDGIPSEELQSHKDQLKIDPRVFLLFTSPSGSGLKVLFKLDKPLYDAKAFHDLAKAFGSSFSKQYDLWSYFDQQTLEVSRATFICPDPDAFVNYKAQVIAIEDYRHLWDSGLFADFEKETEDDIPKGEPKGEAFAKIKTLLGQRKAQEPQVCLSDFWLNFRNSLEQSLQEVEIAIKEVREIQYGLQLRFKHKDGPEAELNVYYGKKGYSIVPSRKANTNPDLNRLIEKFIWTIIRKDHFKLDDHGILRKV